MNENKKNELSFEERKNLFSNIFNTGKEILSEQIIGYDKKRASVTQPYYNILAGAVKCFSISNVVEIGTHNGGSALSMITANPNLQLATIDVKEFDLAVKRLDKHNTCKRFVGDSLSTEMQNNVKDFFANKTGKSLLYIDGLKSGKWIEENIEFYNFFDADYIILDDITIDPRMIKWWKSFSPKYNSFNFVDYLGRECRNISKLNCGFGLLYMK